MRIDLFQKRMYTPLLQGEGGLVGGSNNSEFLVMEVTRLNRKHPAIQPRARIKTVQDATIV